MKVLMDPLDEIVKEFLIECYENLDRLDHDLLALEDTPDDRNCLDSVFRAIHTIKGTSGFLAFHKLEHLTHVGESLLALLRDGKMRFNGVIASGLLAMLDAVRKILANIEAGHGEGDEDYAHLVSTLERLQTAGGIDGRSKEHSTDAAMRAAAVLESIAHLVECVSKTENVGRVAHSSLAAITKKRNRTSRTIPELPSPPHADSDAMEKGHAHSVSDSTVRIEVALLDQLMNLVGELVLTRNQILQCSRTIEDASLAVASQRLKWITTALQEGVMKTRMQPIQNAWTKLPRVVRDLSAMCGKKVQLKMEGSETAVDKTILEAIRDPLIHIVRNSIGHGIESPEIRRSMGKPVKGTLLLRAFHESGHVHLEISDDGGGINLTRVKDKAISQGLISADQAESMSEPELTNLILFPGFSTASAVTNISGRGVGMDVVKTNIEKIGGTLDIQSVDGEGTTLRIKIPLTPPVMPGRVPRMVEKSDRH